METIKSERDLRKGFMTNGILSLLYDYEESRDL